MGRFLGLGDDEGELIDKLIEPVRHRTDLITSHVVDALGQIAFAASDVTQRILHFLDGA